MLCQNCKQQPSTVVFTQIVGQEKTVHHLCKSCAEEMGAAVGIVVSVKTGGREDPAPDSDPGPECAACGTTFAEFAKTGLFGCPACYEGFGSRLHRVLKQIHGVAAHDEHWESADSAPEALLHGLQTQLEQAVSREAFEEAGRLRDRIVALRDELQKAT